MSVIAAGCSSTEPVSTASPSSTTPATTVAPRTVTIESTITTTIAEAVEPVEELPIVAQPCDDVPEVSGGTLEGTLGAARGPDDAVRMKVRDYGIAHPAAYGGRWIDRDKGTFVVAFTRDLDIHRAAVNELMGPDPGVVLDFVEVEFSDKTLQETQQALFDPQNPNRPDAGGIDVHRSRAWASYRDLPDERLNEVLAALPESACYYLVYTPDQPTEMQVIDPDRQTVGELGDDINIVELRLDGDPNPNSNTIELLLKERNCVGGEPIGDRLIGPEILETPTAVYVAFGAFSWTERSSCPGNPSMPFAVELETPLAGRVIIDGRTNVPITTSAPGADPVDPAVAEGFASFESGMFVITDTFLAMDFEDMGADHADAGSESFIIGSSGTEEFQVSTIWEADEPLGSWSTPTEWTGNNGPIQRADNAGAWSTCGDFYIEVLSLTNELE